MRVITPIGERCQHEGVIVYVGPHRRLLLHPADAEQLKVCGRCGAVMHRHARPPAATASPPRPTPDREPLYAAVMQRYACRRRAAKRAVDWWLMRPDRSPEAMLEAPSFRERLWHAVARGND